MEKLTDFKGLTPRDFTAENAENAEGRKEKNMRAVTKEQLNHLSETVIGAATAVHRELGPGLLESAYEACLAFELIDRGLLMEKQKELPIVYRGLQIDCGYRLDLLVE